MDYLRLKRELGHKERTVKDLVSYIGTRTNEVVPNYSLLLGAGASYTSGIKTGVELVSEWREDIYKKLSRSEDYSEQEAKDYLIKNYSNWYSLANEYSALFEYKFDLPSQRRRFVEKEVDGRLPSIGYSYLVSLTTNRFFDTIYTTNFDDLLNEAFYQFSQIRPIVCAHDSSLESISVNSARPKIIKLHGDYLFDDIKSTLRETESLESNIKNKLTQFSKEYGLIVMGYAGNDRSVMDVINFLLKSDEHLKNGVYWCLREGDYINPELTKLLWKDKVYFVKVDGFDEVMAEIHHHLKRELSLDENFTNSKKEAILASFTEDKYKLSQSSPYISSDIEHLTKHKNSMDISNLIRELNEKEFNGSEEDFKILLSIDRLVQQKSYIEAINIIKSRLENFESNKSKEIYLKKLINIYKVQENDSESLKLCDELISIDPFQINNIIYKAEVYTNLTERCKFIQSYQTTFEHSYHFQNYLLSNAIEELDYAKNGSVFTIDTLLEIANKSLSLEPSLDNISWLFTLDLLGKKKKKLDKKNIDNEISEKIRDLLDKARSINQVHTRFLKMSIHPNVINEEYGKMKENLENIIEISKASSKKKKQNLLSMAYDNYSALSKFKGNSEHHSDWSKFMESDSVKHENENEESIAYLVCKSKYFIKVEKDEAQCLKTLKKAMSHPDSYKYSSTLVEYFLTFSDDFEFAKLYLEKVSEFIKKEKYHLILSNLLECQGLIDDALKHNEKSYNYGQPFENYISRATYLNLREKRYTRVISIVDENIGYLSSQSDKDVLTINRALALKANKSKFKDVDIRNIISRGLSEHLILAAHCLLENKNDISRLLKKAIEKDYFDLFLFSTWPVIPREYLEPYLKKHSKCIKY